MKKVLLKLMVCVLVIISCVMGLVACGSDNQPTLDIRTAQKKLERLDYRVEIIDGDDYEFGAAQTLYAISSDGEDWVRIIRFRDETLAKKYYKAKKLAYETLVDSGEAMVDYYTEVWSQYRYAMEDEKLGELLEEIAEMKDDIAEMELNFDIGREGKYVWSGTSYGIEDTK